MSITILENARNMHYLEDLVGWNVVVETNNKKVYAGILERFDDMFHDIVPVCEFFVIRGTDGIANIVWHVRGRHYMEDWIHNHPFVVDMIFVD